MKNLGLYAALIGFLIAMLQLIVYKLNKPSESESLCSDNVTVYKTTLDRYHQKSWWAPSMSSDYCTEYTTKLEQSTKSRDNRHDFLEQYVWFDNPWGNLYKKLVESNIEEVSFLADSLKNIAIAKHLSRNELAELTVTFVQDIPYSFVRPDPCEEYDNQNFPCEGSVAWGIFSPYEFLHFEKGDCDTRSVLIYSLLKYLGYKVMIVISNQYAHAMIALNIPASGDYMTFNKHKYYFWETTAKGWPLGMLPPEWNNKQYWEISLVDGL